MALSLITSPKSKAIFKGIKTIPLDATISEDHSFSAKVTSNPVETGSDITDHVSLEPLQLSITGLITDTPVQIFAGIQDIINRGSGGNSRSRTALEDLETLWSNRQPFDIVTGLRVYKNMVIKRLSVPRDRSTGRALRFTADLIEVRFAEFETKALKEEQLERDVNGSSKQAQGKMDVGKQPLQAPSSGETESGSVLYNAFKDIGVL